MARRLVSADQQPGTSGNAIADLFARSGDSRPWHDPRWPQRAYERGSRPRPTPFPPQGLIVPDPGNWALFTWRLENLPAELRVRIYQILLEDYFDPTPKADPPPQPSSAARPGRRPARSQAGLSHRSLYRHSSSQVAHRWYWDVTSLDFTHFPPPRLEYKFAYDLTTTGTRIFDDFLIPNIRRFTPFRGLCIDFLSTVCASFQIRVHDSKSASMLAYKVKRMESIILSSCYKLNVALVVQNGATVIGNASVRDNIPKLPENAAPELVDCFETLAKLPAHFRLHLSLAYPWFEYQRLNKIAKRTGFAKRVDAVYVREGYTKAFLYHAPAAFDGLETFHQQQILAALCDVDPPESEFLKDEAMREALEGAGESGFHGVKRSGARRLPKTIPAPNVTTRSGTKAENGEGNSTSVSKKMRLD